MSRICDFPLSYISKAGEEKIIYVDSSDYVRYVSGERTIDEAFGHYLDEQTLKELKAYEDKNGKASF